MGSSRNNAKALKLAGRFALPPNSLGYCGRDSAPEKFKKCFINGECEDVEEELEKFIVLHPYLKTISEITGKPKYSYEVIESYCIGNELLNEAKPEHYDLLLDNFLEQGVPDWFVNQLRDEKPKRFIPHHLFQVLHVGVGRASGAVPFNLDSINNCMIRWGEILEIKEETLQVNLRQISKNNEKYVLETKISEHNYKPEFLPGLKIGKNAAVHWKQTIKLLTDEETQKLEYWTEEIIQTAN